MHRTSSTPQVTQDSHGDCPVSWSVSTSEPVAVSDPNRPLGTSMSMHPDINPIATASRVLNGSSEDLTVSNRVNLDSTSPHQGQRPMLGSISAANISSSASSSCSTVAHGTGGEQCGPSAETGSLRSSGSTSFELSKQTLLTEDEDLDCAICLDTIQPRKHAKATLACRHEFHLSCIS